MRNSKSKQSDRNVTLARQWTAVFRCFLCGIELPVKMDKNGKLYFICNRCGVQAFIRGYEGIKNLERLIKVLREHDYAIREHTEVLHTILGVLSEIEGLEKELEKLDSILDVFASKRHIKDQKRVRKSLNARIDALLLQLDHIAHADAQST